MNMLGYDATIAALESRGVPREKALKFAREQWPEVAAQQDAAAEKRADVLEKKEQAEIVKLFRAFGFKVYNLSQARASKQTPGLPDLFCMDPERRVGFWWESKRSVGGTLSASQMLFRDQALACGINWGSGDRVAAKRFLVALGAAKFVGDTLEPIR